MASVFERKWITADGKEHSCWAVSYKDQHGKWRIKSGFEFKREANDWKKKTESEVAAGPHVAWHRKGITCDEVAQMWLERLEPEFEQNTADSRRWRYVRHIQPQLGQVRL